MVRGFGKLLGSFRRFFRRQETVELQEIIDGIIDRLAEVINSDEGMIRVIDTAVELEKEYGQKTGLRIRVHVDEDRATIWINDLKFEYLLVDEVEDEKEDDEAEPAREDTPGDPGGPGRELPYIR